MRERERERETKRIKRSPPVPIVFDIENPLHLTFIRSFTEMNAKVRNISIPINKEEIMIETLLSFSLSAYTQGNEIESDDLSHISLSIPLSLSPISFDKDDHLHMDLVWYENESGGTKREREGGNKEREANLPNYKVKLMHSRTKLSHSPSESSRESKNW